MIRPSIDTTSKKRVPELLRVLQRLAAAAVAVIVCVGILGVGRGRACLLAQAVELVAAEGADERMSVKDGADRSDIDAFEEADSDDDDPLREVAEDQGLAVQGVPVPRKGDPSSPGELPIDTSHFVPGSHEARGPPA